MVVRSGDLWRQGDRVFFPPSSENGRGEGFWMFQCKHKEQQRQRTAGQCPQCQLPPTLQTPTHSLFSWLTCNPREFCHVSSHGRGYFGGQKNHSPCSGTFSVTHYHLNEAETKLCMSWARLLGAQPFLLPWSSYKSFHILWLQSNKNKTDEAQLIWLLSIMQWASEWL